MRLAQHMAVASDRVTATAIEATEFPDLSQAYRVSAVSRRSSSTIASSSRARCRRPQFLDAVLQAVEPATP